MGRVRFWNVEGNICKIILVTEGRAPYFRGIEVNLLFWTFALNDVGENSKWRSVLVKIVLMLSDFFEPLCHLQGGNLSWVSQTSEAFPQCFVLWVQKLKHVVETKSLFFFDSHQICRSCGSAAASCSLLRDCVHGRQNFSQWAFCKFRR